LSAFGHLDVLVNNASSFYPTPVGSITEAHWDDLIGTNLKVAGVPDAGGRAGARGGAAGSSSTSPTSTGCAR
jgi:NAD(P)-dependent dehydrogenase (short-subunit alcohol dehydrogenase family)